MAVKYFISKISHTVFLDDEKLPIKIYVPKKKRKNIVVPIWLITLFESKKYIVKIYNFFKSRKETDPSDPDDRLIDSILDHLAASNKDEND